MEEALIRACQKTPARVPRATYRLQFNRHFGFRDAAEWVDYLWELGISDVYASPVLQAGPNSTHGYDVCAFGRLNAELGTEEDWEELTQALRKRELGLVLDIVPNHMAASLTNPWWFDTLEKGRGSAYGDWFDINWDPPQFELKNKILLPILEDHYGRVLESGKLKVVFNRGQLGVSYYDRAFPLSPASYSEVLKRVLGESVSVETEPFQSLAVLIDNLSAGGMKKPVQAAEFEKVKEHLHVWYESSVEFRKRLGGAVAEINGQAGKPRSFDFLDALLRAQYYRLAYWRVAAREINYRRFFDVIELVGLRVELPEVFEETHRFLMRLVREGKVTGLRVDHPDGLWNSRQYLERLQTACGPPFYVIAEKILMRGEELPDDWPVAGTTGYDFLNVLNAIFVQRAHAAVMDSVYRSFSGLTDDFEAVVYRAKKHILRHSLPSEVNALAHELKSIASSVRMGQDLTLADLREGLTETLAAFPAYRTYLAPGSGRVSNRDRELMCEAVLAAKARTPKVDPMALDFLQWLLLLQLPEAADPSVGERCRHWVMRFQQLTAPVMAKGLEDSAFYRFNRLMSLNEVGGNPAIFGGHVEPFHTFNTKQAETWPHSLLATATHDTKRGEDVRARLNVLSEMPQEWRAALGRWSELNAGFKSILDGQAAPHANDEYLFYQTLVGAWPAEAESADGLIRFRERISAYMLKAAKEAKVHTSWSSPDSAYEEATNHFVDSALSVGGPNSFLDDFKQFHTKIDFFGTLNSLSQVLLKLNSPGVADFYQGTELWDFSLVDPDNRRRVDFELRHRALAEIQSGCRGDADLGAFIKELFKERRNGWIKLYVIWRVLQLRRTKAVLYQKGDYVPLISSGLKSEHVCAFMRAHEKDRIIVVAPRLVLGLTAGIETLPVGGEIWSDTSLAVPGITTEENYRNVLTNEAVTIRKTGLPLGEALASFPLAVLEKKTI